MAEDNPAELVIDADRQATKYSPQDAEENLDDRTIPEVHFKTSRLSVRTDSSEIRMNTDSTVNMESAAPQQGTGTPPTVPNLGRPQSAPMSKHQQKQFFAYRPGAIEAAVNECKPVIKQDVDGEIRGVWLLTEIDHWDNEKERLVLLNDNSLLSIKYDFVACKLIESKRIMLKIIDKVIHGLFEYPDKTIATPRDGTGIRAYWNKGVEPSVAAKWNPWSKQIPWITFTSHPLQFKEDRDTDCYKAESIQLDMSNSTLNTEHSSIFEIDTFKPAFVQAIQNVQESKSSEGATALSVLEAPLFIDNYVGFASLVHNQSHLGFSRERGGISF